MESSESAPLRYYFGSVENFAVSFSTTKSNTFFNQKLNPYWWVQAFLLLRCCNFAFYIFVLFVIFHVSNFHLVSISVGPGSFAGILNTHWSLLLEKRAVKVMIEKIVLKTPDDSLVFGH